MLQKFLLHLNTFLQSFKNQYIIDILHEIFHIFPMFKAAAGWKRCPPMGIQGKVVLGTECQGVRSSSYDLQHGFACTMVLCHRSNTDTETMVHYQDPLCCVLIRMEDRVQRQATDKQGWKHPRAPWMNNRFGDGLGGVDPNSRSWPRKCSSLEQEVASPLTLQTLALLKFKESYSFSQGVFEMKEKVLIDLRTFELK